MTLPPYKLKGFSLPPGETEYFVRWRFLHDEGHTSYRVRLFTDKGESWARRIEKVEEKAAIEWERQRKKLRMAGAYETLKIEEHRAAYAEVQIARSVTSKHARLVDGRNGHLCEEAGFKLISDICPDPLDKVLSRWLKAGVISDQTARHHCANLKSFTAWLFATKRLEADRLKGWKVGRGDVVKTFGRGTLSDDQRRLFLNTVRESDLVIHRLSGTPSCQVLRG